MDDLQKTIHRLRALAIEADAISRRLEIERKDHALHRVAVSCRDLATAINHALATLS